MEKTAIIIGAGPAGLTAAFELLERTEIKPIILEATFDIGGISKTINYKGNRIDIGGHRFFSKSNRVMQWWKTIMEVETDNNKEDMKILLVRKRLSRILYHRRFYDYPITLSPRTIFNLGFIKILRIMASYLYSNFFPIKKEISLKDFFVNRFGNELYRTFFEDYTKKVWGVSAAEISPDWGSQRVKGVSISESLKQALKNFFFKNTSLDQKGVETSLISTFLYPKLGPGQMWEEVASIIIRKGGKLFLGKKIIGIRVLGNTIDGVEVIDSKNGDREYIKGDYFFSSMPVRDLIKGMGENVPFSVKEISNGLLYRDFISVGILVKKIKHSNADKNARILDNWIYIQEPDVKMARLQIFNNWSPYLVHDKDTVWFGAEYFCTEGDEFWRNNDEFISELAIMELAKIGLIDKDDYLDSVVIRMPKAYPAYFGTYDRFSVIRNFLDKFNNLFLIGRNGMHRYNNQDHSMLTAMVAVDNIVNNNNDKGNIWDVNTEKVYSEKITAIENLSEGLLGIKERNIPEYRPDNYWEKTETAYSYYPTVRHRKRFILYFLRLISYSEDFRLFDYGCGTGDVIQKIKEVLSLTDEQVGGCDVSERAIAEAKKKIRNGKFIVGEFPDLDHKFDVVICSEVIEHIPNYIDVLKWIYNNLKPGGNLILTTQSGKFHKCDIYTGHKQHFNINQLAKTIESIGFKIKNKRLWGFPFFSLQKYLTDYNFDAIRNNYLEGNYSLNKKIVFSLAYYFYYLHDYIFAGPQIFITAIKDN